MIVSEDGVLLGPNDLDWRDLVVPGCIMAVAVVFASVLVGCGALVPDIPNASGCLRGCNAELGECVEEGGECFDALELCFDKASQCSHACDDCERLGLCTDEDDCDRACADKANACTDGLGECAKSEVLACIGPLVECTAVCIEEVEDAF